VIGESAAVRVESDDWLSVELQDIDGSCRLLLEGALCGTSIAALQAQIDQIGTMSCEDVVVDVSKLTKLDRRGEGVLFGLYHYVVGRGGKLRFVGAKGWLATAIRQGLVSTPGSSEGVSL
jgi:anti-anti-sigma regulatory factor